MGGSFELSTGCRPLVESEGVSADMVSIEPNQTGYIEKRHYRDDIKLKGE